MKKWIFFILLCNFLMAQIKEVKMVIYNQNFAVCDEERAVEIPVGKSEIVFKDIPSFIEPTSVQIHSMNYPTDLCVLEQVFDSDLFNSEKIFLKNIGEKIDIIGKTGDVYSGKLLSYDGKNLGIETKDKILILNRDELKEISFNKTDEFLLKPQIKFLVQNNKKGIHRILLKYTTSNINWKADYVATYVEDVNKINLEGFITIDNKTGVDFKNVSLVLIAGEVKKMIEKAMDKVGMRILAEGVVEEKAQSFEGSPIFEYYKYTLKGKTDIKNGEIKQINFISRKDINVNKKFIYEGATYRYYYYDNWRNLPYNEKVQVLIEFKNENEVLPSGKIRVFKYEKDGTIFIGENFVGHVPIGEAVKLPLGYTVDVKGERKIMSHERISSNVYKDTYEIKIKNFKKEDITVEVIERLYGAWEIIEKTHNYEKMDAYTIKFPVKVKANGEEVIKYTVTTKF